MRAGLIFVGIALGLLVAGCGDRPAATVYKKGEYSGKRDTQPWVGEQFKGDRLAWERAIKARSNGQNEYARAATK